MIDVEYIANLAEEDDYYLFPEYAGAKMRQLEGLSVVSLRISSAGFDSMVNEALELPALMEFALFRLQEFNRLYAAFVELTPKRKSRLRSYKGMLYGLHKELPEARFVQKEFDLPEGYSQFAGLLALENYAIPFFARHLLISPFFFGLIIPENLLHKSPAEDLLDKLYALMTPEINRGDLNEAKVMTHIADWRMMIFRTMTDGQDRQYLEFYGRREQVEPTIVRFLLPRMKEKFYFRGAQSRMQGR